MHLITLTFISEAHMESGPFVQTSLRVGSDYAQVKRRSVTFLDQNYVERRSLWAGKVY